MAFTPLPKLLLIEDFGGNWSAYRDFIYEEFVRTAVDSKLKFRGLPVTVRYQTPFDGMHWGFWHLITSGEYGAPEEDRVPDMRRCERILWVAHFIRHADLDCDQLKVFENKRGSERHVVVWLPEEKYLVILAKRDGYFLLKSAYRHGGQKTKSLNRDFIAYTLKNG